MQSPCRNFRGPHAKDHLHRLFNAPRTPLDPIPTSISPKPYRSAATPLELRPDGPGELPAGIPRGLSYAVYPDPLNRFAGRSRVTPAAPDDQKHA